MKKIIFLFLLIIFFLLSYSLSYAGAPPTATSCPVCPNGFIWNNAYNTCQDSQNAANYRDPLRRVNCSASGPCCTNAIDGTCSSTGYCSSNPPPPPPENVYNCANRDPRCPTSSYPRCQDFPYNYLYSCAPPYCVMHNLAGGNQSNWTTSCSWANGQPQPYSQPPPSNNNGSIPQVNYGGVFGGPATSFSCGSGANSVWTLDCIFPVFATLISWALTLAGTIALIFIIVGGIRFIISGGDPKKIDQARKTIVFSVVGLVVIFLSFFILSFIGQTTGVACINPNNPLSFTSCQ